jgi:hypothetical protein
VEAGRNRGIAFPFNSGRSANSPHRAPEDFERNQPESGMSLMRSNIFI